MPDNKYRLHQIHHANAHLVPYILLNYRYAPNSMQCCTVPNVNHHVIVRVFIERLSVCRGVWNTV